MDISFPITAVQKQQWLNEGRPIVYPACAPEGVNDWDSLRTIEASWIQTIFANQSRLCNKPVKIENAIIVHPLRLQHATAQVGFRISSSIFREPVDFSYFTVRGALDLRASRFERTSDAWRPDCSFRFARCEQDLILEGAQFDTKVSFRSLDVIGNVLANEVSFADDADFAGSRLGRDVVSFGGATFGGTADFRRIRVTGNLFFGPSYGTVPSRTVFRGRARYDFARVDGRVTFEGACFQGDASFEAIEVDGTAQFRASTELGVACVFHSRANFLDAVITSNLDLNAVEFSKEASFVRLRVGHSLFCRAQECGSRILQPTFRGGADFTDAAVERNVNFAGARFGQLARFDRMQAGPVWFSTSVIGSRRFWTVFAKGLEMRQAKIGGTLICSGVQFAGTASFTSMQISGGAYFQPIQVSEKPRVWFQTRFRGQAIFDQTEIAGGANFSGVQFRADAS